jgi:hypothetical protein
MYPLIDGACSICEKSLNETGDLITTNCNHTFHRACVQERLDNENRIDCHICHMRSTLGNALSQNSSTTTPKSIDENLNHIQSDQNVSY